MGALGLVSPKRVPCRITTNIYLNINVHININIVRLINR